MLTLKRGRVTRVTVSRDFKATERSGKRERAETDLGINGEQR